MGNILAINIGSTSLKYKLFNEKEEELKSGKFENEKVGDAVKSVLREIGDLRNLESIGHRIVHGGSSFSESVLITSKVLNELKEISHLAPLHNPYNLAGVEALSNFLPEIPQVACFDTSFYFDMPEIARTYALPREITEKYKIKRYGFHGISHKYAAEEAARQLGLPLEKTNLIICHLGGGWSATAIKKGKPIDTSMGFTPLEGLVMMTRAGDLDPGILIELLGKGDSHLVEENVERLNDILNHESGIKALSGIDDYLQLLKEISYNDKAKLAFDVAVYKLVKYIGAYWLALEGKVDALVFTGEIGAGNPVTRNQVARKLKALGSLKILTIKSNEELGICREVKKILNR